MPAELRRREGAERQHLLALGAEVGDRAGHQRLPDAPAAEPPRWVVEDTRPQAGFLQVQNRAPCGGFFEPRVRVLDEVKPGERLGVIRDPLGRVLHEVLSQQSGIVVFLRTFPRVQAGDPLCTVLEC